MSCAEGCQRLLASHTAPSPSVVLCCVCWWRLAWEHERADGWRRLPDRVSSRISSGWSEHCPCEHVRSVAIDDRDSYNLDGRVSVSLIDGVHDMKR